METSLSLDPQLGALPSPGAYWGCLEVWGWADDEMSVGLGPPLVLRSRIKKGPEITGCLCPPGTPSVLGTTCAFPESPSSPAAQVLSLFPGKDTKAQS